MWFVAITILVDGFQKYFARNSQLIGTIFDRMWQEMSSKCHLVNGLNGKNQAWYQVWK